MTEGAVRLETGDRIAYIRFNRPDRMNVIDVEMAEAFSAAVDQAVSHADTRAIILSGEGRCFMAGGDLAAFRQSGDRSALARAIIAPMHRAIERLAAAPQITIAAIHGPVAGAGMSLALAADFCVAAAGTTLNLAYQKVGAPADCGATWTLPRLVGLRRAMEIALLSGTIPADEALALGIVNRVVAADALGSEAAALASRLAQGPGLAQARLKRLMRDSLGATLEDQLAAEEDAFADCALTDDFGEALDAFFSRRAPAFTGH